MSDSVLPPVGDPKRQATGATSGFVYQFWQAADAWLRLGAGDSLFLEHGEDFDVVDGEVIVGTQVKGEAGDLSLGRKQARDAIAQCWDLRLRNTDRDVSYRYLTTRARGFEAGKPFGDRLGLDVWDGARRSDEDLTALRVYLSDQTLPQDIQDLLATGTDAAVRREIIQPMRWDTSAPDARDVERLVEERLITHGSLLPLPVPALASRRVSSALFRHVATRSTEGGVRRLTWADFVELFEEETMERVPGGSASAAAVRAARTPGRPAQAGDPGFLEPVRGTRLPIVIERADAVELVRRRAHESPLSAIIGSTGSGKTILAELAAEKDGEWYRLDLRALPPDSVARRIDEASLALFGLPDGSTVLLDDLSVTGSPDRILTSMGRLLTAASQQAIHVVVTSSTPLPTCVDLLSPQAGAETSLVAPMLTDAELGELASGFDCPPAMVPVWTQVIAQKTSGHPHLAAAYAANARARGWPEPSMEDATGQPAPIADVRAEARATLRGALRDAAAFDLIQRLSVLTLPFTRGQALRIAQTPPPLGMAALDLDALVGPWIEAVGEARYRLSPLIEGLYRETLPAGDHHHLRAAAADAIVHDTMATGRADVYDVSSILFQGILSGNGAAVAMGAGLAKTASDFSGIAEYLGWLAVMATGVSFKPILPSSPAASLSTRELQFRIALETARDVEPVLVAWRAEIDALEKRGEPVAGHRVLLAMSVLMDERAKVSDAWLVDAASIVLDLPPADGWGIEAVMDRAVEEHGQNDAGMLRAMEASAREVASMGMTPTFVFQVLATRVPTADGAAAFIESALTAPMPVGPAARKAFEADVSMTESVASTFWIRASNAETSNWNTVLAELDTLSSLARIHGLTALAVSVERTRAVVLNEELRDRKAAEASLQAAEAWLGDMPRLREYQGKILRTAGEHDKALAFYEALMPTWHEEDPNTSHLYAYHDVIESAGLVGEWERAAFWAREGEEQARRLGEVPGVKAGDAYVELCYAVDGAYAVYEAGNPCEAIASLNKVVQRLPAPTEPRLRMLIRRVTLVIGWIHGDLGGMKIRGLKKPAPGLASRFEQDPDEETVLEITSVDFLSILDESARLAGCEVPETPTSGTDGVSLLSHSMRIRRHLNEGIQTSAPDLPDRWLDTIRSADQVLAESAGQPYTPRPPDLAGTITALTYGVVSAIGLGRMAEDVVSPWSERMGALFGDTEKIAAWQSAVELAFEGARRDLRAIARLTPIMRDGTAGVDSRMVAASALAKASRDPIVRDQALALLAASASVHPFGMAVGSALAALSGRDVAPGKGVQETARLVLASPRLAALGLDLKMIDALRVAANDGPSWGMQAAPPQVDA